MKETARLPILAGVPSVLQVVKSARSKRPVFAAVFCGRFPVLSANIYASVCGVVATRSQENFKVETNRARPQTRAIDSCIVHHRSCPENVEGKDNEWKMLIQLFLSRSVNYLGSWEDEDLYMHSINLREASWVLSTRPRWTERRYVLGRGHALLLERSADPPSS